MKAVVCGLICALTSPAFAQDAQARQQVDATTVAACFDGAARGATAPDCLGRASEACQIPGYEDTPGIVACIDAETAAWHGILVEQYEYLMRFYRARGPQLQNGLRDAQRAWTGFRDAECALDQARWGEGSFRVIVAAHCRMTETAERALELRDKKEF